MLSSPDDLDSNATPPSEIDNQPMLVSFNEFNGTCGFDFEEEKDCRQQSSIPASFYRGKEDLQGLTVPPLGSNYTICLPTMTENPSNACFTIVSQGNQSVYQPRLFSPSGASRLLRPLTMAAIISKTGDRETERLFAVGLGPGSGPVVPGEDWKPDWMVLSEDMPVNTAKKGLEGLTR
jgi:hypothetical protein